LKEELTSAELVEGQVSDYEVLLLLLDLPDRDTSLEIEIVFVIAFW